MSISIRIVTVGGMSSVCNAVVLDTSRHLLRYRQTLAKAILGKLREAPEPNNKIANEAKK